MSIGYARFKVTPAKNKIYWALAESMLDYVVETLKSISMAMLSKKQYLIAIQSQVILETLPPKKVDDYPREMLIQAKTSLDIKQDRRLERIQQKVINMGPLAKL